MKKAPAKRMLDAEMEVSGFATGAEQITHLEKSMLTDYVGESSSAKLRQLRTALQIAFDIRDDPETGITTQQSAG